MQKRYLIAALQRLIRRSPSPSPALLATHLRACLASGAPEELGAVVNLARAYTGKSPDAPDVWLARLDVERACAAGTAQVEAAWAEARQSAKGAPGDLEAVWAWGLGAGGIAPSDDAVVILEVCATIPLGSSAFSHFLALPATSPPPAP